MFMTGESMLDGALNGKLRQRQRRAVSDAFAVTCRIDRKRTGGSHPLANAKEEVLYN